MRPPDGRPPTADPVSVERSDVQLLLDASSRMAGCTQLPDLFRTATSLARLLSAASVASLGCVDQDTLRVVAVDPPREDGTGAASAPAEYRASRRPALRSLLRDHRSWVVDANHSGGDQMEIDALLADGMATAVAIPVLVNGAVWGQLHLARREPEPFTSAEVALLEVFAMLLAGMIMRLDIVAQVQNLIEADPLTGLPNRRAADHAAVAALASGATTCVVMCDVDGLKRINDELGHERGDELLRTVADVLRRMREALPGSTAVRLGGDEFCLITVDVPAQKVREVVEHELALGALAFGASLSYGISSTEHTDPGVTTRSLFRLADAAQYRAKRSRQMTQEGAPGARGATQLTVLDDGLTALDTLTRDASGRGEITHVEDRLVVVAAALTEAVGAMRWYVSTCDVSTSALTLVRRGEATGRPDTTALTDPYGRGLSTEGHAPTHQALEGGAYWAHVSDPDAPACERALLAATDATAVIAAGGPDASGRRWLVELYFDGLNADVENLSAPVRAVVAAAVVGPA